VNSELLEVNSLQILSVEHILPYQSRAFCAWLFFNQIIKH